MEPSWRQLHRIFTDQGFDGVWSSLTGLLRHLHRATHLPVSLNTGWCLTPQNYSCPVCGLRKPALIHVTNETLSGVLHVDHDHMADGILSLANELDAGSHFNHHIQDFLRYQPVLVCRACNHIDSVMKTLYPDIDPLFSLTPAEKKSLIIKPRISRHKIDHRKGYQIWLDSGKSFQATVCRWQSALFDMAGEGGPAPAYNPKKEILSTALKRYISALSGYNYFQEFHEFIRQSATWHPGKPHP